jgi:hypothetical protein
MYSIYSTVCTLDLVPPRGASTEWFKMSFFWLVDVYSICALHASCVMTPYILTLQYSTIERTHVVLCVLHTILCHVSLLLYLMVQIHVWQYGTNCACVCVVEGVVEYLRALMCMKLYMFIWIPKVRWGIIFHQQLRIEQLNLSYLNNGHFEDNNIVYTFSCFVLCKEEIMFLVSNVSVLCVLDVSSWCSSVRGSLFVVYKIQYSKWM